MSKIIEPLRSRCIQFRLPLCNNFDIFKLILHVDFKESLKLTKEDINLLIKKSENNLNYTMWLLELKKNNINIVQNWHKTIDNIINLIYDDKNLILKIIKIREYLYLLFITNIKYNMIIKKIMNILIRKEILLEKKYNIINISSDFDYKLSTGTRYIIHLEAYIINLIKLLN